MSKVKNTISITEARKRLFDIAEEVQKPGITYTLTEYGRPRAVFMSADDHESLIETLEVLKDFPDLDKDIAEVEKDLKSGAYHNYITLEELLAQEGYVVADKGSKNYEISRKVKTSNRKRA